METGVDEIARASPACQRAVKETIAALKEQGHEIVEIDVAKLEGASISHALGGMGS